jgi:hypothetical protein
MQSLAGNVAISLFRGLDHAAARRLCSTYPANNLMIAAI